MEIAGVSSNEAEDGQGDSDTAPDWEITGDLTGDLRAERAGGGGGRVYTLEIACEDGSGNVASAAVEVDSTSLPAQVGACIVSTEASHGQDPQGPWLFFLETPQLRPEYGPTRGSSTNS